MTGDLGFLRHGREVAPGRAVEERLGDFAEFGGRLSSTALRRQGARCMDCGTPFCHGPTGCPLGNRVPAWNRLVADGDLEGAARQLHATSDFPEITGRVCPAPCETACTLGINRPAVTIKQIEREIADRAWAAGLVQPRPPAERTGRSVAVVGSGPAGLAAAAALNRAGHHVTVFERADAVGGLLRYGIPDFKLDKALIDRRVELLAAEGVTFRVGADVGRDVDPEALMASSDAAVLATGATVARDLAIPGRDLAGVHLAMDYLTQSNRRVAGRPVSDGAAIDAAGKHVVVIGGGDTGSDCIGTALRQGAAHVTELEILPRPPEERGAENPWPNWPFTLAVSSAHDELRARFDDKEDRRWCVRTTDFLGREGRVTGLRAERVRREADAGGGPPRMMPVPGSAFELRAELVLLALGFLHPEPALLDVLGVERDARGNALAGADSMRTSEAKVFAAGDCRRGQSLVVWALAEGRDVAHEVDAYLCGASVLPRATLPATRG